MGANPFLGVFLHWLGGVAAGAFYVPYRGVRDWSGETYWLLGGPYEGTRHVRPAEEKGHCRVQFRQRDLDGDVFWNHERVFLFRADGGQSYRNCLRRRRHSTLMDWSA